MELLDNLNWRYATKKFDATKKVSTADLDKIKEAVRLSASSYGLQLFKVLIVDTAELREKLEPASWGQKQITEASHLFVFCNYSNYEESQVDEYVGLKASLSGLNPEGLKGYADFVKGALSNHSEESYKVWTAKQTYIALGNLMAACAELKIDSTPMEGFVPEQYNEILGLSEKGLNAAVVAAVGYRSENDATQHAKKVRKSNEDLFEVI